MDPHQEVVTYVYSTISFFLPVSLLPAVTEISTYDLPDDSYHSGLGFTNEIVMGPSCAGEQLVFIGDSCTICKLNIHRSDTGEHVGCLSQQDLGLQDENLRRHVGYGEGDVLHRYLQVRNTSSKWTHRFVAYKVR